MIQLIFTLDYEIYGNGEGSLKEILLETTKKINEIFDQYNLKYVNFVEAAELIKIKEFGTDSNIINVESRIKDMYDKGYEIGLHIHPQWFKAYYSNNKWALNWSEYNLCLLAYEQIDKYIGESILYLRKVLNDNLFVPISYRAGGWLIQPTPNISKVLVNKGIKIESSVFKGGFQRYHNLDFRNYPSKLYYWKFNDDVLKRDENGQIFEVPIHARLIPLWKMFSKKRIENYASARRTVLSKKQLLLPYLDKLRFWYPQKFDFTKMTFPEMKSMLDGIIKLDSQTPNTLKPVVLIGHSKNIIDFRSIDRFVEYVIKKQINVVTFKNILPQLQTTYIK